jgi:hypothetical protein
MSQKLGQPTFSGNRTSRHSREILTESPKSFGRCGINGPRAHTAVELVICGDHRRDVAVFAINAALTIQLRAHGGPNCGSRALLDSLEPQRNLAGTRNRDDTIHSIDTVGAQIFVRHVATKVGEDFARMHGKRANAMLLTSLIELHSK